MMASVQRCPRHGARRQGGIDQVLLDLVRTCHVCGCTDERACFGGCWWANDEDAPDLCSSCADGPRQ